MPSDTTDLTALLGSRICHDLISPLGAISNGVELLTMTGAGLGPEIELITDSILNANARIRFFRVAFGSASADQRIGKPEVTGILADLTKGGRLTFDWQAEGDQSRREVKLVFLLLQCFETAMPYGGEVAIGRIEGRWLLRGTARKLKVDPELWDSLLDPSGAADIGAAQVHFALIPMELRRQEKHLRSEIGETDLVISF